MKYPSTNYNIIMYADDMLLFLWIGYLLVNKAVQKKLDTVYYYILCTLYLSLRSLLKLTDIVLFLFCFCTSSVTMKLHEYECYFSGVLFST